MSNARNIVLIGFMGTGKTAVAARLAETLGLKARDVDTQIETAAGRSIGEIFASWGEERFRELETEALQALAGRSGLVVACGGGAALRDINVRYMKEMGTVALLTASPETVCRRIKDDSTRPLLNGGMSVERITELMEQRRPRYESAADITVQTDGKTVNEVCAALQKLLEER